MAVTQVCVEGHVLASGYDSEWSDGYDAELIQQFCPRHGTRVYTSCPQCAAPLEPIDGTQPPQHCHACGSPFPWASREESSAPRPISVVALWSVLRSVLAEHFSFAEIKVIVGLAGIPTTLLAALEQRAKGGATKSELLSAVDAVFDGIAAPEQKRTVRVVVEEVLRRREELVDHLDSYLRRLGWTFREGNLIPLELLDVAELSELPTEAQDDLAKAAIRLRDGDISGAISAACAAVDAVTAKIYASRNLGKPSAASFQEKVAKSVKAIDVVGTVDAELTKLGWPPNERKMFIQNLQGAVNQTAFLMQSLRSNMGDVHGTKPALSALAFDCIKWAALTVRLLAKT